MAVAAGGSLLIAAGGRAGRAGADAPGAAGSLVRRRMDRRGHKRGLVRGKKHGTKSGTGAPLRQGSTQRKNGLRIDGPLIRPRRLSVREDTHLGRRIILASCLHHWPRSGGAFLLRVLSLSPPWSVRALSTV